jgi:pyruvate dehydrogenase E1 component alpha subunit
LNTIRSGREVNAMYQPRSEDEALQLFRKMALIRQAQEAIMREYPKEEMKTPVHLGIGLEGVSVGVAHCLPAGSKSFGQLRNHGQYLALTGETDAFFGELYGRVTGTGGGKAGSMHLCSPEHGLISTSGIVASTIPLAVGAGLAAKYQGTNEVAVTMFGDAAIEEGEYWEAFNFACLHGLRVLFVCEDNDLAIHTWGHDRRGFDSITGVLRGFRCYPFEGDGDLLEVIDIVRQALDLMERNPRPAFLRFKVFRFLEHVGPNTDFRIGYRSKPSDEELLTRDPVYKYEQYLRSQGIPPSRLQVVRDEVQRQIEASIAKARSAPFPTEADLYRGVFV